jgi:hypothetical protein
MKNSEDKPTRAEEIKHKLISLSFEFEDSDGVKHSPWITLEDAIRTMEQYRTEGLREEHKCKSCGEPLSYYCDRCQHLWET